MNSAILLTQMLPVLLQVKTLRLLLKRDERHLHMYTLSFF